MSNQIDSASDIFDTILPLGIKGYPEPIHEIGEIFQFKILGEGGGNWIFDCQSVPPTIKKTEATSTCSIEMEHEDFKKLLQDPNIGFDLFFSGKIRITGEVKSFVKLAKLYDITRVQPLHVA